MGVKAIRAAPGTIQQLARRPFVAWIKTLHCIQIDPYPGEMDETADGEDELPEYDLSNLAPWYRHLLQVEPENNARFLSALKDTLSGFQSLRFSSVDDGVRRLRAHFEAPQKEGPFIPSQSFPKDSEC